MEIMKHMKGMVVKNDTNELAEALDLSHVTHKGNYIFMGYYGTAPVEIKTEPTDDSAETIRIISINTEPDSRQKLEITYRLISGEGAAESYIELPITSRNYELLTSDALADKEEKDRVKLWINVALQSLVKMKGYEELGTYSINLKMKAD